MRSITHYLTMLLAAIDGIAGHATPAVSNKLAPPATHSWPCITYAEAAVLLAGVVRAYGLVPSIR
jgi:hypothetical protein